MAKRGFKFGTYVTADPGWTLTSWTFTEPELIENYITVPGRLDGPLDASTALTNGDPRYGSRKLTATFECSDFTRSEHEKMIDKMRDRLDGWQCRIYFPDSEDYYAVGRLRFEKLYNDLAHASVRVTAICEPWRYKQSERFITLHAQMDASQSYTFVNEGRRRALPTIEIASDPSIPGGESVSVSFSGEGDGGSLGSSFVHSLSYRVLGPGTHQLPDFYLLPYENFTIRYAGTGLIKVTYREAIL